MFYATGSGAVSTRVFLVSTDILKVLTIKQRARIVPDSPLLFKTSYLSYENKTIAHMLHYKLDRYMASSFTVSTSISQFCYVFFRTVQLICKTHNCLLLTISQNRIKKSIFYPRCSPHCWESPNWKQEDTTLALSQHTGRHLLNQFVRTP